MATEVVTEMEGMIHADPDESTLFEIKEMLIDLQISIATIFKENPVLKKEIV